MRSTLGFILVAAIVASAGLASASSMFNASSCRVAGSSASTNAYYGGGGTVGNNDTSNVLTLLCPLTKDLTDINRPDLLSIEVVDNSSASDAACYMQRWRIDAGSGNREAVYDSAIAATAGVPASQDSPYWVSVQWDYSTYSHLGSNVSWNISCTVPAKQGSDVSYVGNFNMTEF